MATTPYSGGWGGFSGAPSPDLSAYGQPGANPWLQQQGNAIANQAYLGLNTQVLPGINRAADAAGGVGGSRQGIAQGLAIGQAQQGVTNSLADLYGNAYNADMNRAASMRGQDLNYGASMAGVDANRYATDANSNIATMQNATTNRNLDVQMRGQDVNYNLGNQQNQNQANSISNQYNLGLGQNQNTADANRNNFYTQQRGQDITQQGLGANLYGSTLNAAAGAGSAGYGGGFNWQQALGGAIGGTQLWNNLNNGSTSSNGWW